MDYLQQRRKAALERVQKLGLPDGACWPWPGKRNKDGYGIHGVKTAPGKEMLAHRAVYEAVHGPITEPDGCVLHDCDNRPCCNPRCLKKGTRTQNAAERDARQRQSFGEKHYAAILSNAKVVELRARAAKGEPLTELAAEMGIRYKHAWKIVKGQVRRTA